MPRARARDIGITIGTLPTGPNNAITDVEGVRVGHTTLIAGDGPLVVGQGPIRTGVTVIVPHDGDIGQDPLFAGYHILNGNGEMTGLAWVGESGLLTTPIAITNTHSVGVVRDALIAYHTSRYENETEPSWDLPVVSETYDGFLSDINGHHVRAEHVFAALDTATGSAVAEGTVGGGTGMICHQFKGGIGTSSRVVATEWGGWTVGVLVQANYGLRRHLRIDGVPVGAAFGEELLPGKVSPADAGAGSIIVVVATDAPLLPHQCRRLAQRATMGIARCGGNGADSSGDLFLAFATGNRNLGASYPDVGPIPVRTLPNYVLTPLFEATADATEEAIVNSLCAATSVTGIDGRTVHAIPLDRLKVIMDRAVEARGVARD